MKKTSKKKLPLLSEAIDENDKIKILHKKVFLNPSKIRRSELIAKKITINK